MTHSSSQGHQSFPQGCFKGILCQYLLFLNCWFGSPWLTLDLSPCHCHITELSIGYVTIPISASPALMLRNGMPSWQSLVSQEWCLCWDPTTGSWLFAAFRAVPVPLFQVLGVCAWLQLPAQPFPTKVALGHF